MPSYRTLRFILKTPKGYLTSDGFSNDICDRDIIVLNLDRIWESSFIKQKAIKVFFEYSNAPPYFNLKECNILSYNCSKSLKECWYCPKSYECEFWNNRSNCELKIEC